MPTPRSDAAMAHNWSDTCCPKLTRSLSTFSTGKLSIRRPHLSNHIAFCESVFASLLSSRTSDSTELRALKYFWEERVVIEEELTSDVELGSVDLGTVDLGTV